MRTPALISLPLLAILAGGSAEAAVVCKAVGVPKGCVAAPAPVVVAPVATPVVGPNPVVRRAGLPGTPTNRGGPVNRVGRR